MNPKIGDILERMKSLGLELEKKLESTRQSAQANGLIPYFAEIVGRTEQHWCPIKHAERLRAAHSRYKLFTDYGDAEGFLRDLEKIRKNFEQ